MTDHSGAEEALSQGGADGLEAWGGAEGSDDWGAWNPKGLKGDSIDEAEALDGFGKGGGRGMLGGTICDKGDLELGRANGDK